MFSAALKSTLDYCLFTLGFIAAVQLPEFIQQYKQYIAGKLSESSWHLNSYQQIADQTFNGNLSELIKSYLASSQTAIAQTGEVIAQMKLRHDELTLTLAQLNSNSYLTQLWHFFHHLNIEDVQTVAGYYQLAVPLTIEAIVSGVVVAFIFVWLRMLATYFLQHLLGLSPKFR